VEVSQVKRRLTAAIEQARRDAQQRRERSSEVQRAYAVFLADVAVPVARMAANVLKAEGYAFTVATPGGGLRLISDKGRDDYVEIALDTTAKRPDVIGYIRYARGSRTVAEERPVKAGAAPQDITEDEFLEFLVSALEPWLER
jgi:phosphoglycolate phosphatase-like HAD superfamily hydrolase